MSETISSGTVNITSSWIGVVREKRTSSYNEKKKFNSTEKNKFKKKIQHSKLNLQGLRSINNN